MKKFISLFAASLALAGAASAQMITAERPDTVVRALQDKGYRASLSVDSVGDPMIESSMNGWNYRIYFYECTNNTDCGSLQFSLGFDLPEGADLTAVNNYNQTHLIGSASLDHENDPFLKWLVSTRGGLTRTNFDEVIAWWEAGVVDFERAFPFPASE